MRTTKQTTTAGLSALLMTMVYVAATPASAEPMTAFESIAPVRLQCVCNCLSKLNEGGLLGDGGLATREQLSSKKDASDYYHEPVDGDGKRIICDPFKDPGCDRTRQACSSLNTGKIPCDGWFDGKALDGTLANCELRSVPIE